MDFCSGYRNWRTCRSSSCILAIRSGYNCTIDPLGFSTHIGNIPVILRILVNSCFYTLYIGFNYSYPPLSSNFLNCCKNFLHICFRRFSFESYVRNYTCIPILKIAIIDNFLKWLANIIFLHLMNWTQNDYTQHCTKNRLCSQFCTNSSIYSRIRSYLQLWTWFLNFSTSLEKQQTTFRHQALNYHI